MIVKNKEAYMKFAIIIILNLMSLSVFGANLSALVVKGSGGGSTFAGYTTTTYTGALGGLTGANAKCQSEFSGSHFCNVNEFVKTGNTVNPTVKAWILSNSADSLGTGSSTYSYYGCAGWVMGIAGYGAGYITTGGRFLVQTCDTLSSLTCCKN